MKTRAGSVTERIIVYAVAVSFWLVMAVGFVLIRGHYNSQLSAIRNEMGEIDQQAEQLKNEISRKESQKAALQEAFERRREARSAEEDRYHEARENLNKALGMLPPESLKASILEALTLKAMELNIQINSSREITIPVERYSTAMFVPASFAFDIEGEYGNIKRYLWTLDHVIQLEDSRESARVWNVVLIVASEPDEFIIVKFDHNDRPILPQAQYSHDAAFAGGAMAAASRQPSDAHEAYAVPGSTRIMSLEGTMRLQIQVLTYLRPDDRV